MSNSDKPSRTQPDDQQSPEMRRAQRELDEATERAAQLGHKEQELSLDRGQGKLDAKQLRADMEQTQRQVKRAHADVQRASDRVKREIERQMSQMRSDLEARMSKVNAALAPVKKRLEFMQEGIETLGLYLSAAQGVVVIRDGQRAPDQEPIIIRQMVLSMDEETGLFAEEDGMTAADVDAFDEWLLADPAHVDQIVPEPKCVVALVSRWAERERGNPWSHDPKDKVTHFLIRNGQALSRTTVNDFHAGRVLIPRADEFIDFFRTKQFNWSTHQNDAVVLTPGTREYAEAMEASDKRSRHFLRIGLILQGLVDNSDVFEPLHPAGINMLTDPSERSEKVRIVTDAEGGLSSGEATFTEWQEALNARLRPGMRIIAAFNGMPWSEANDWADSKYRSGHSRVYPSGWDYPHPPSGVPLLIEDRRSDGGLVCRFDREPIYDRDLWVPSPDRPGWGHRGGRRPAKQRASVTVYPTDSFVLAYDLIDSSAQLRGFLASRRNRRDYRDLWPLIRSAMFAKAAEEKAEAPFATMLSGVLARENDVTVEQAAADVPELMRWFKLKNRWTRALTLETMVSLEAARAQEEAEQDAREQASRGGRPSAASLGMRPGSARARRTWREPELRNREDEREEQLAREREASKRLRGQEHQALAVRLIVAEHARRVADRRRPINAKLVSELKGRHPEALLIARPRRGGYLVLLPAHPTENVWVHELDYNTKGELRERTDWRLAGGADRVSRWTVCFEHPRFADWSLHASEKDHLRGPELEQLAGQLIDRARKDGQTPMMVSYQPATQQGRSRLTVWVLTDERTVKDGPSYSARDFAWKRAADGTVSLLRFSSVDYWVQDEHEWVLDDKVELPWQGQYAERHVGDVIWGPDRAAVARWRKLRHAYVEHSRREREFDSRAYELGASVADQWKALAVVALYDEFMAEVPDAHWEEWEAHLKEHGPQWSWSDSHHHPHGALGAMVRWLVAAGVDPTGLTAQQALDLARENGLPDTWEGFRDKHPFPEAFPEQWASLVIGAEPVPAPEPPAPEPEPEETGGGFKLADGVEVVGPEQPEPDRDEFDDLRDSLRDIL